MTSARIAEKLLGAKDFGSDVDQDITQGTPEDDELIAAAQALIDLRNHPRKSRRKRHRRSSRRKRRGSVSFLSCAQAMFASFCRPILFVFTGAFEGIRRARKLPFRKYVVAVLACVVVASGTLQKVEVMSDKASTFTLEQRKLELEERKLERQLELERFMACGQMIENGGQRGQPVGFALEAGPETPLNKENNALSYHQKDKQVCSAVLP